MCSLSYEKGFLPTSTPVQNNPKVEDSGYFSNDRINGMIFVSSTGRTLFSPVKKISPIGYKDIAKKIFSEDYFEAEINDNHVEKKENFRNRYQSEKSSVSFDQTIHSDCTINTFDSNGNIIETSGYEKMCNTFDLCITPRKVEWQKTPEKNKTFSPACNFNVDANFDRSPPSKKYNCDTTNQPLICSIDFRPRALFLRDSKVIEKPDHSFHKDSTQISTNSKQKSRDIVKAMTKYVSEHEYVNFIVELQRRGCMINVVSEIFENLSDEDLCKVSFVCRAWRNAVLCDKVANQRRKAFFKKNRDLAIGPSKENIYTKEKPNIQSHGTAFLEIHNLLPREYSRQFQNHNKQEPKSRLEFFFEEEEKLNAGEVLSKCPKCFFPAKGLAGQVKSCCTRVHCQYIFCTKCSGPYLYLHKCLTVKGLEACESKIIVCGKKSKKNLRRL